MSEAKNRQVGGDHYKKMGVQPWDVIDTWPIQQQIGYYRGNLLKYTMRMGSKESSEREIAKAGHYAQKLEEVLHYAGFALSDDEKFQIAAQAARLAVEACKAATGRKKDIDTYVSVSAIAHKVAGTELGAKK